MPDELDEIIVTGRPRDRSSDDREFPNDFNSLEFADEFDRREDGRDEQDDSTVLEEVTVVAKRGSLGAILATGAKAFSELLGSPLVRNLSDFERLMLRSVPSEFERLIAKPLTKAIPEIVVTAKRSAGVLSFAERFNIATALATIGGTLAARISDDLSQARLDALGFEMTQEDFQRTGDTPTGTIDPEVIDEITVRARRPFPRLQTLPEQRPPDFPPDLPTRVELAPQPLLPAEFSPPSIPRPRLPDIQRQSDSATNPFADFQTQTGFGQSDLTRLKPSALESPQNKSQTSPRTFAPPQGMCEPCPKPTRTRRKKNRTECYRKMVKEARNPANDKEFRWTKIDCDTGREIPPLVQLLDTVTNIGN